MSDLIGLTKQFKWESNIQMCEQNSRSNYTRSDSAHTPVTHVCRPATRGSL